MLLALHLKLLLFNRQWPRIVTTLFVVISVRPITVRKSLAPPATTVGHLLAVRLVNQVFNILNRADVTHLWIALVDSGVHGDDLGCLHFLVAVFGCVDGNETVGHEEANSDTYPDAHRIQVIQENHAVVILVRYYLVFPAVVKNQV